MVSLNIIPEHQVWPRELVSVVIPDPALVMSQPFDNAANTADMSGAAALLRCWHMGG